MSDGSIVTVCKLDQSVECPLVNEIWNVLRNGAIKIVGGGDEFRKKVRKKKKKKKIKKKKNKRLKTWRPKYSPQIT